jgi:hypothetical protein
MAFIELSEERLINPVDTVESVANVNEWPFDRSGDDEITISVQGQWSDYHIAYTWMDDLEALHCACAFDLKVPEGRRNAVRDLVQKINEQLWVGHFDFWSDEGVLLFRHALPLPDGIEASQRQCELLMEFAVEASERYFQAFQFVVWAGKSPEEAMAAASFETVGEA